MVVETAKSRRPSLCFVTPGGYNLLSGRADLLRIGGAEVQMVTLARALAERGLQVSAVTLDHGQPDGEDCDGIKVYRSFDPTAGLPGARFFHPRWTKLNAALERANADVYLQACGDTITGQVALWCRRQRRRFVFVVMLDSDCDPKLPYLSTWRERACYRAGLKRTDLVIAQTEHQVRLLHEWQGIPATVVRPCGGADHTGCGGVKAPQGRPRVLWLGRFAYQKRLEWLWELARRRPQYDFDVVGDANVDDAKAQQLKEEARSIPNVHLHGAVPHAEVDKFYAQAHAVILTSRVEGFPSVFIEAWSWGLPTISTVDVDNLIARERLGAVAPDVRGLATALDELFASREAWSECSRRAHAHYTNSHTPAAAGETVARLIEALPLQAVKGSATKQRLAEPVVASQ